MDYAQLGLKQYPPFVDFGYTLSFALQVAGIKKKELAALLNRDPAVVSRFIKGSQLPSRKQINQILSAIPDSVWAATLRRAYSNVLFDPPSKPSYYRNAPEYRKLIARGDYEGLYFELRHLRNRHTDPAIKFSIDIITFELCLVSSHFYRATLAIQRMKDFESHEAEAYAIFGGVAQGLLYRQLGLFEDAVSVLEKAHATLTPGEFRNTNIVFGFSVTPLIWHELALARLQMLRGKERIDWAKHAALETYDRIDDDVSDFDKACSYTTLCHCLVQLKDAARLRESIKLLEDHWGGYHEDIGDTWWYAMCNPSRFQLVEAEASLIEGNLAECLARFSDLLDEATKHRDTYHLSIAQRRFQEISRRALTEGIILPDSMDLPKKWVDEFSD